MRIKDRRVRKCGPGFALTVVQCRTHGICFTLYPLGWVPYGRQAVVDPARPRCWARTLFAVALATASAQSTRELGGYRRTRHRQVRRAAQWVGVDAEWQVGETIAGRLGVGLATHEQARRDWRRAALWSKRAAAVQAVLRGCPDEGDLLWRMLACGHAAGVVGRPWQVGAQTGALLPVR